MREGSKRSKHEHRRREEEEDDEEEEEEQQAKGPSWLAPLIKVTAWRSPSTDAAVQSGALSALSAGGVPAAIGLPLVLQCAGPAAWR